jgi:hypothetical protein
LGQPDGFHAKVVFAPPIGAALKVTFDMNARLHDNMSIAKQVEPRALSTLVLYRTVSAVMVLAPGHRRADVSIAKQAALDRGLCPGPPGAFKRP